MASAGAGEMTDSDTVYRVMFLVVFALLLMAGAQEKT